MIIDIFPLKYTDYGPGKYMAAFGDILECSSRIEYILDNSVMVLQDAQSHGQ